MCTAFESNTYFPTGVKKGNHITYRIRGAFLKIKLLSYVLVYFLILCSTGSKLTDIRVRQTHAESS